MNLIVPQVKLFAHSSHSMFYSLAAVYVCSFCLVEHLRDSLRAPNLYSEWGCWLLLAALAQLVKYSRGKRAFENKHQSDRLPLALVALILCWNFGDVKWAVVSVPTSLLVRRYHSHSEIATTDSGLLPHRHYRQRQHQSTHQLFGET